jgi:hypothetical protein
VNRGHSQCRASTRSCEAWKTPRATLSQSSGSVSLACRSHTAIRHDDDVHPCSNISSAARQIAQFVALCQPLRARKETEPLRHCGLPGSWERPDNGSADRVLATAAKGDAPDFEMPAATGNDTGEVSSSGHPISRDTTPRRRHPPRRMMTNAPARAPSFRSWRSPPTVRRASVLQATGLPLANRKTTLEQSLRRPLRCTSTACLCRVPWRAICVEIG